jgi:hypothetical protein
MGEASSRQAQVLRINRNPAGMDGSDDAGHRRQQGTREEPRVLKKRTVPGPIYSPPLLPFPDFWRRPSSEPDCRGTMIAHQPPGIPPSPICPPSRHRFIAATPLRP